MAGIFLEEAQVLTAAFFTIFCTNTYAQDLLFPHLTPLVEEDKTIASIFEKILLKELEKANINFADGTELLDTVGFDAENCSDSVACPSGLWPYYPDSIIALVGKVGLGDDGIHVEISYYDKNSFTPIKNLVRTVQIGEELPLAQALAKASAILIEHNKPSPPPVVPIEDEKTSRRGSRDSKVTDSKAETTTEPSEKELAKQQKEAARAEEREKAAKEKAAKEKVEAAQRPQPVASSGDCACYFGLEKPAYSLNPASRREKRKMKVSWKVYEDYAGSGLGMSEYARTNHINTSPFTFDASLGLAFGDTGRSYDVRQSYDSETLASLGTYQSDVFYKGTGLELDLGAWYGPVWWGDIGFRIGFTTGQKQLSSGWELYEYGDLSDSNVQTFDAAASSRGLLEPRIRLTPFSKGLIQPWVLGFSSFRKYDDIEVPEVPGVEYQNRPSGWLAYLGFGFGATLDINNGLGLNVSWDWARKLGEDGFYYVNKGFVEPEVELLETSKATSRFLVGLSYHL